MAPKKASTQRNRSVELSSPNPFNPGFGVPPPIMAGRQALVHTTLACLARGPQRHDFHTLLVGPRGTGKTVLLAEIERLAGRDGGVLAMHWSGTENLQQRLSEQRPRVEAQLRSFARRGMRRLEGTQLTVKAAPAGIGAEARFAGTAPAGPSTLSTHAILESLGRPAAERNRVVVLFADEMQSAAPEDLRDLAVSLQQLANVQGLPLALIGAGLPHTRQTLLAAKVTFLERLHLTPVGLLDDAATSEAIQLPFAQAGRLIDPDALAAMVRASGGYPYAIQLIGAHCWDEAGTAATIDIGHAQAAAKRTREYLELNVFEATWQRISPADRYVLYIAARLRDAQGRAETGAIARELQRPIASITAPRDRLINRHGVLFAPERGAVEFVLPGFAEWVGRHGETAKQRRS